MLIASFCAVFNYVVVSSVFDLDVDVLAGADGLHVRVLRLVAVELDRVEPDDDSDVEPVAAGDEIDLEIED